jgi:hypothetical protein
VLINKGGERLLSRRVASDEPVLIDLIGAVEKLAGEITWAIDLAEGPAPSLIAPLLQGGQRLLYLPGIAVNRATSGYRGEARPTRKSCRHRRPRPDAFRPAGCAGPAGDHRGTALTAHRADVAADRTRTINRLRARLTAIFPALERALDFANHGPTVLLSGFQTAYAIRAVGAKELQQWLRGRHA